MNTNNNDNWNTALNWYNHELIQFNKESSKIQESIQLFKNAIPKYDNPKTKTTLNSKIKAIKTSQKELIARFDSLKHKDFDYYFTFDIYHNKKLKFPLLTFTQLVNTNSNTKMKIKLVWKKQIKDHTKESTHKGFEQFIEYLSENNIDYSNCKFHSDKESSWIKLKSDIKSQKDKFTENYIDHESLDLLLTKGAKNSPLKEPCQPYDPKELETKPLRDNSKALIYNMILKQIKKHNTNLFKRLNSDTFLYKLRKDKISTGN